VNRCIVNYGKTLGDCLKFTTWGGRDLVKGGYGAGKRRGGEVGGRREMRELIIVDLEACVSKKLFIGNY